MKKQEMLPIAVDLIVIGAGAGGYTAALHARSFGMSVVLIEKEKLGGTCVHWGCIPTKSLLYSCELYKEIKNADIFGISTYNTEPVFDQMIQRSRACATRMELGIDMTVKKAGIQVIKGKAVILDSHTVQVFDTKNMAFENLTAKHILIATGAKPKTFKNIAFDSEIVWSSKEALQAKKYPETLAIIGAGAIGMEMATFFNALGSKVTVLEGLDRVLPEQDEEISKNVLKFAMRLGITVITNVKVSDITKQKDSAVVSYLLDNQQYHLTASSVLLALGVYPNTSGLGLENVLTDLDDRGGIKIDEWGQTAESSIFAIGDVTAPPFLAHKAMRQALICVDKIANIPNVRPLYPQFVPGCVFCTPQVASVGLTQKKAQQKGLDFIVKRSKFITNGKAVVIGQTDGFIKLIVERDSGLILGAHCIGPNVSELIHSFAMAMTNNLTYKQATQTIFPHPTLSETIENALDDATL